LELDPTSPRRIAVPTQELRKKRVERVKSRVERLTKKVSEMETKLGKRTGDLKLRKQRKQMKRAQRRLVDLEPKKSAAAAEAGAAPKAG
jgi:phage shock protein A